MPNVTRLCLVLHNHQPVGNFHEVFEQAYQDSYRPFLDVFADYPDLHISLHTSGPLMEWLDANHPEYLDRLADHVAAGRVEIIGGPFYEPILTMIPGRDRRGQILSYTNWLTSRLGGEVRGMWMPERVWEQSLVPDLVAARMQYTILDDFHFKNAGLTPEQLFGYYLTEDEGQLLRVFPGSERLRYLIPFAQPEETIAYLREIYENQENAVVVFGDDGEKFGTWPDTKRHVYDDGWLRRFFDALRENQSWLRTATLAEAVDSNDATGKIYLPEGSYREMTEWALPYEKQHAYEDLRHEFHDDPRWDRVQQFVRGGFWRNFKVRYPDTDDMYTRMLMVSQRIEQASQHGLSDHQLDDARRELYRGQCNCSYWHGAFGGAYLPHLRHAVYNHLIAAENLVDEAFGKQGTWIESYANDFNLDGLAEVRLANDQLICLLAPHQGGHIYELDVRPICLNLSASLDRHPEAYHRKVLAGPSDNEGQVSSIHDRVVFKQAGLDQRVQYDTYRRKSLIDHFYGENQGLEAVAAGQAQELGSFVEAPFQAVVRRNPDRCQVKLTHDGHVGDVPVRITKGVTLEAGSDTLEIAYLLDGVPNDQPLHFGVEFNFAGLPGGADDRYFATGDGSHLGNLSQRLELSDIDQLDLIDEWQGIGLRLTANRPTHFWTFPLESVSQSEGGFELVQQSVVVMPRWYVLGDMDGRWSVTMSLKLDTSVAMSRRMEQLLAATS